MWQRRLKLGTYFRIGVYVHWSFAFLVAYVGFAGYQDGLLGAAFGISLLLGMFLCVTLHEYGHALMARRFGIETMDITLFPIGGVARLMQIPRVPWQEFLVAVAGPAVNVVIVTILGTILFSVPQVGLPSLTELATDPDAAEAIYIAMNSPSVLGYLLSMLLVNTALILFNMIPAFPMDGGRVLRSILAMGLEYRRATRIAAYIGVVCAVLMFTAAIYNEVVTAGLIAVFICYAGLSEARQVEEMEPLRNLAVGDAMIFDTPYLGIDTPVAEFLQHHLLAPSKAVPVVDDRGVVVGMLLMADAMNALQHGHHCDVTAGQLLRADVPILSPHESLESVVSRPIAGRRQFAVADERGRLIGLLDLDTLRIRAELVV